MEAGVEIMGFMRAWDSVETGLRQSVKSKMGLRVVGKEKRPSKEKGAFEFSDT